MKKLTLFIICTALILTFSACQEREITDNSSEIISSEYGEDEVNSSENSEESEEIVLSEDEQKIYYILNSGDSIISNNISCKLTENNKKELFDPQIIKALENKGTANEHSISPVFSVYKGTDPIAFFTNIKNEVYIKNNDGRFTLYVLSDESLNDIIQKAENILNESIANGNSDLTEKILAFNDFVRGGFNWATPFNDTIIEDAELEKILDIKNWKLNFGEYKSIDSEKADIVFLNLNTGDPYVPYLRAEFAKIDGICYAQYNFFEGPSGQNQFIIPEEVYNRLVEMKKPSPISSKNVSKDDVIKAYKEAQHINTWITVGNMDVNYDDMKEDGTYRYCKSLSFVTMDEFKNYMRNFFSEEMVDYYIGYGDEAKVLKEYDGKLYVLDGSRGTDLTMGEESYEINKVNSEKIELIVTVDVLDDTLKNVIDHKNFIYNFEYIDGKWVFTNFPTIR